MTRGRARGFAAYVILATLAAIVLGGAAVLNRQTLSGIRHAAVEEAAALARRDAERALVAAVESLARVGVGWRPDPGGAVRVAALSPWVVEVRAVGRFGRTQAVRRVRVTCDDTRESGQRVASVVWAP